MLRNIGSFFADRVSRWLPESLVFAFILTMITGIAAVVWTPTKVMELVPLWYRGFWTMLEFAMQMALIITLGYAIGISRPVARLFDGLANRIPSPVMAYFAISVVSLILVVVNWGLAPVAAVFAAEVCRRVKGIDFRMACAAVYCALIPWHGGLSASAPLMMNTPDNRFIQMGLVQDLIPTSATLGSSLNITLIVLSFILIPLLIVLMAPKKAAAAFDAALQFERAGKTPEDTAALQMDGDRGIGFNLSDFLNNNRGVSLLIVISGFVFIVPYFAKQGLDGLNLNSVNFFFLMVGLLLHGTPAHYIAAIREAVKGIGDLIIQFPFYAGIMGIFMFSGLSGVVAQWFIGISTTLTFPFFAFLTAAIVNMFIPSGGAEWIVLAPALIPAANELGVPLERLIVCFAYGDGLTNLINPFWTLAFLPVMAKIMNVKPRDFMGYSFVMCAIFFVIISLAALFVP